MRVPIRCVEPWVYADLQAKALKGRQIERHSMADLSPLQGWLLNVWIDPGLDTNGGHRHEYMRCPPFVSAPWAVICRPVGASIPGLYVNISFTTFPFTSVN